MRDFFSGWRRKAGCAALVMACGLTGLWIHSRTTRSETMVPVGSRLNILYGFEGHIYWVGYDAGNGMPLRWGYRTGNRSRDWLEQFSVRDFKSMWPELEKKRPPSHELLEFPTRTLRHAAHPPLRLPDSLEASEAAVICWCLVHLGELDVCCSARPALDHSSVDRCCGFVGHCHRHRGGHLATDCEVSSHSKIGIRRDSDLQNSWSVSVN